MKRPLACMFGFHLWVKCDHYWSLTKTLWHCRRCTESKTTILPGLM